MSTAQSYIYRARTKSNQLVTGRVQAPSLDAAKKILLQNSLTPLSLTLPKGFADYLPFMNRVSLKEKTLFARQLSTMLESGLTIAQALQILIKQSKKGRFQGVMTSLLNDIQDGFSFSNSLAKFPEVFDTIFINVARAGEATGKLEMVLTELAHNMEKEVAINGKIRGALFYPGFILIVMVAVGLIMTTQVIPQLKDIFLSSGKELPGSTTFLLNLSDSLISKWYLYLLGVIAVIVGFRAYIRTEGGTVVMSKAILKAPVIGGITQQTDMARFARLLGLLLSSGVPMLEALRLITDSFDNRVHRAALRTVAHDVERGIPMSVPIAKDPAFPLMVPQMVSVGEQTGKMDEVMIKLAEYYESEVDSKVGGLATLVEPIVIVILGIGVAWLVQAILLPIYQISTSA